MKTLRISLGLFLLLTIPAQAIAEIGVIVNKDLYPDISFFVDQYVQDLRKAGETVWLEKDTYNDDTSRSALQKLRKALRDRWLGNDLTGAVLIGQLPRADYESSPFVVGYMKFPIDYYFMDLDKETDDDWKDDNPTLGNQTGVTGVFDKYTGDKKMEIWVSRIIAHNLIYPEHSTDWDMNVTIGHPIKPPTDGWPEYQYGEEADIIKRYLARVHDRATKVDDIPIRGLSVGDYKNGMDPDIPGLQNLDLPYVTLKYPHDTVAIWARELRKGYAIASIFEHSNPGSHEMARDQGENNNSVFWWGSLLAMPLEKGPGGGPARVRFFNDMGCSNLDYGTRNCLGQMYAMLHNGLISMGSTGLNWFNNTYEKYTQELATGKSFGESFKEYVNTLTDDYGNLCMVLLGAGTLKFEPDLENPKPQLVIKKVWAEKPEKGLHLHGDVLTLRAEIACLSTGPCDTGGVAFTWHGLQQSATGNPAQYVLEGHNAPLRYNGGYEGEYFVTLHAEKAGYQPAVEVLSLKGWKFEKVGSIYSYRPPNKSEDHYAHLNRHFWEDNEWVAQIRGRSGDIGGQNDDFVFYSSDIASGDFEVTAKIKRWENEGTATYSPGAKAGVMIRLDNFTNSANAFMGVTYGQGAVFQYRGPNGGDTRKITVPGYAAGDTWVRLRRFNQHIHGYLSNDGINFQIVGSMVIGPEAVPLVGFAYACNDPQAWADPSQERAVVFSSMKVRTLSDPKPVIPRIEYVNEVDGTYTAYFGYHNPNQYAVVVAPGIDNRVSYQGQETPPEPISEFQPGDNPGGFSINFDGSDLSWTLNGKTLSTRSVEIRHLRITPILNRVVDHCDGQFTAYFGYDNPHQFAVVKEIGPLNELEYTDRSSFGYPIAQFQPGENLEAFKVKVGDGELVWSLDGNSAPAKRQMSENTCPAFKFYKAFAFGSNGWTRSVPNAPGANYIKVVQGGDNFLYDPARGYGYTETNHIDNTGNNQNVLSGDDEIYDQFIGVQNTTSGYSKIKFRVDVPPGIYRFVAAGGDARHGGHITTITALSSGFDHQQKGGPIMYKQLVENKTLPANTFYRVGYDDKVPPAGDGIGAQPNFLELKESPFLIVPVRLDSSGRYPGSDQVGSYIAIEQTASGLTGTSGGDLCLIEIWYTPAIPSVTEGHFDKQLINAKHTTMVTQADKWLSADRFFGFRGIDKIGVERLACGGSPHQYAVGWHGNDVIEYLMQFGGDHNQLILRGKADRPGPVTSTVFVDGKPHQGVKWDKDDNCSQDVVVDVSGIPFGSHAVAVRLANDYWIEGGGADKDLNLYLEGLIALQEDPYRYKLIEPIGGETYNIGQQMTIRWVAGEALQAADISVSFDDGKTFHRVNTRQSITRSNPQWGHYSWRIPERVYDFEQQQYVSTVSKMCRIRVSEHMDGSTYDESDLFFEIRRPPALAYDGFDYPVGTALHQQGGTGGGWAGPWENVRSPQWHKLLVESGSLAYRSLEVSGNHAVVENTTGHLYRPLAAPLGGAAGTEVWLSFVMGDDDDGAKGAWSSFAPIDSGYGFSSNTKGFENRLFDIEISGTGAARALRIKKHWQNNTWISPNWDHFGAGQVPWTPGDHLVVVRISIGAEKSDVAAWVDPADFGNLGAPQLTLTGNNNGPVSFDGVLWYVEPFHAYRSSRLDEVRIGSSLASVTPAAE